MKIRKLTHFFLNSLYWSIVGVLLTINVIVAIVINLFNPTFFSDIYHFLIEQISNY
jgi:hypothetical protein